jgi:hypothetical protein
MEKMKAKTAPSFWLKSAGAGPTHLSGKFWYFLIARRNLEGDIQGENLQADGKPVFIVGWFVYWILALR